MAVLSSVNAHTDTIEWMFRCPVPSRAVSRALQGRALPGRQQPTVRADRLHQGVSSPLPDTSAVHCSTDGQDLGGSRTVARHGCLVGQPGTDPETVLRQPYRVDRTERYGPDRPAALPTQLTPVTAGGDVLDCHDRLG